MPRYIDADAFIQFVETNESIIKVGSRNGKSFHTGRAVERYYIFDLLRNAPTISPDEVRGVGKWVDKGVRAWSCSCCGTPLNHIRQFASFEKNELPNYCPNCGARLGNGGTDDS